MSLQVKKVLFIFLWSVVLSGFGHCPIHFKPFSLEGKQKDHNVDLASKCVSLNSEDPLLALNWFTTINESLSSAVALESNSESTNKRCHVWTIRKQRIPNKCDRELFSFEVTLIRVGCQVTLTYLTYSTKCYDQSSRSISKLGVTMINSLSKAPSSPVDLLKVYDNGLGSMPAVLSTIYSFDKKSSIRLLLRNTPFISLDLVMYPSALLDIGAGDVSSHAWQIWSSYHLLQSENFIVVDISSFSNGTYKDKPMQYTGNIIACSCHHNTINFPI